MKLGKVWSRFRFENLNSEKIICCAINEFYGRRNDNGSERLRTGGVDHHGDRIMTQTSVPYRNVRVRSTSGLSAVRSSLWVSVDD